MAFMVGQKVVCVDAEDSNTWGIPELIQGEIYTIAWVGSAEAHIFHPGIYNKDTAVVHLQEVRRQSPTPFSARRFRPVVERKTETDIAIFKKMLIPAKQKESV
jgi:hypothetical protein